MVNLTRENEAKDKRIADLDIDALLEEPSDAGV